MSRKKKKQTIESATESQVTETNESTSEPDYMEEQITTPIEDVIHLSDAARRFAKGFKEHWVPGILSYAQSKGLPLNATEKECKNILRMWGATVE